MESVNQHQCPVRWHAIHHGEETAVESDALQLSYQVLDEILTDLQTQLIEKISNEAVTPNRIACIASNGLPLLLLQLVCLRGGWIFCPLNPRFSQNEIAQRLSILDTPYCWVEEKTASTHFSVNTLALEFKYQQVADRDLPPLEIEATKPCSLIFTSGSSGFPKAIVHHYQNHFFSALGSQTMIPLAELDKNLLSLPLFHIGGYATVIRTLCAGACLHLTEDPLTTKLIEQREITHLSLVSTQLIRLLAEQKFEKSRTAIKHILLGGSTFPPAILDKVKARGFNYHLSYGCTEMASQVATSNNNTELKILPYRKISIKNDEVYLRGATRFIGYFKDKKIQYLDKKSWVAIGDTGELKTSGLTIFGRKDRQFISGGENIIPEEIERICLLFPSVKQAYILPFEHTEYGQRIVLFVDFFNEDKLVYQQQKERLESYLTQQLTGYKRPDHYFPWPQKNANNQALKVPKQAFIKILESANLT